MSRKRRKHGISESIPEPDTLPLMNIIFMLILALLTMAAVLPLGFLSSEAQKLASATAIAQAQKEQKAPLNLILFITNDGFNFAINGQTKTGEKNLIPKIKMPDGTMGYNYNALLIRLKEYKKIDPEEQSITITADPKVIFDVVVQVMDIARFDDEKRILFPKVSFAAGLVS